MIKLVFASSLFFISSSLFSLKEKQEIIKVDMSMKCLKTNPCQHQLTVTYENGKKVEKRLNSLSIATKYWDFISSDSKNHLLCNPQVFESKIKQ